MDKWNLEKCDLLPWKYFQAYKCIMNCRILQSFEAILKAIEWNLQNYVVSTCASDNFRMSTAKFLRWADKQPFTRSKNLTFRVQKLNWRFQREVCITLGLHRHHELRLHHKCKNTRILSTSRRRELVRIDWNTVIWKITRENMNLKNVRLN